MTEVNKKDLKTRIKENKILTRTEQDYLINNINKLELIEQVLDSSTFHPNSNKSSIELLGIVKNIYEIVKGVEENE